MSKTTRGYSVAQVIKRILPVWFTLLRVAIVIGFFYLWIYWTFMSLAFSDETQTSIREYLITFTMMLIQNSGLLIAVLPFPKIIKWIAFLPLAVTTFLYVTIFGATSPAWGFAITGLLTNLGAILLIIRKLKTE
ncbi:hypothetical protein ACFLZV_07530 [Candidatus Margulisiibacteriota bacterium]